MRPTRQPHPLTDYSTATKGSIWKQCGLAALCGWLLLMSGSRATAVELTEELVRQSIDYGVAYLRSKQDRSGAWNVPGDGERHVVGVTSLCLLALTNCGVPTSDPSIQRGLGYLRNVPPDQPRSTYDVSLAIMALVAAKDHRQTDFAKIVAWSSRLAASQSRGNEPGGWTYDASGSPGGGSDLSNSQFALLALREAAEVGVVTDRAVWAAARQYWTTQQSADGGWSYTRENSTGSMTAAGLASLSIIDQMLRSDEGVGPDGAPPCCRPAIPDDAMERGLRWMANHFATGQNPGSASGAWLLYYLYGVERAGRLSGQRFFGDHDWYREGTETLLRLQTRSGAWQGVGVVETEPEVGTPLALLFLSKGLSPIVFSKLKYGPRDRLKPQTTATNDWNIHPRDARSLADFLSGRPQWPALMSSQEVDIGKAVSDDGVRSLLQSRVIYITGPNRPEFTPAELDLLKQYVEQGGFILAAPTCSGADFEAGLRDVLSKIFPPGEGELKRLPADHPVYRSEFLLESEGIPLYGVDFGCRTSVIYAPEDLGCLWEYWQRNDPPTRSPQLKARILRATSIGVNVLAYATGRQPPGKLSIPDIVTDPALAEDIERGLLQVAKIRHSGQWDAAPRALRNLLLALNKTVGLAASSQPRDLNLADAALFEYPLIYLHGREAFAVSQQESDQLREYLQRGGVLFADACCGARPFDQSFRDLVMAALPDAQFEPIPVTHEMFSEQIGHDVRKLRRRTLNVGTGGTTGATVSEQDVFLEGVEIDGRLAVIYSRYDISCALERQSSLNCEGYLPEDAVKLATNIVLYAMQQAVRLQENPEPSR